MNRANLSQFYKDNTGLLHVVARKGYGRLQAIGASIDYEDLVQELSITFIRSFDLFDEMAGCKFSTYFMTAAYHEVNKIADAIVAERVTNGVRSVEEIDSWSDEEGSSVEERIANEDATPYQVVAANQLTEMIFKRLSPLAVMIAKMAIHPPEFMELEFEAATAHAEVARGIGIEKRARGSLNVSFVCSVLTKTNRPFASRIREAKEEVLFAFDWRI